MGTEALSQSCNLSSIESWNENAIAWNQLMGEGSDFQIQIVDQALQKLLPSLAEGSEVLELACGNGFLARRMAVNGSNVYAIDSSFELIEFAKQRTSAKLRHQINYQVGDVTKKETYDQINSHFDLIICNMALMDISDLTTLFECSGKLLKADGCFIITQTHPCFEKAVGPLFHESEEGDGTISHLHGVKVLRYLNSFSINVKAVPTLPKDHLFFHRSLSNIFQIAFKAGFVIDGLEEIAFPKNEMISEHNGWHLLNDIPVVIGIRFKLAV